MFSLEVDKYIKEQNNMKNIKLSFLDFTFTSWFFNSQTLFMLKIYFYAMNIIFVSLFISYIGTLRT